MCLSVRRQNLRFRNSTSLLLDVDPGRALAKRLAGALQCDERQIEPIQMIRYHVRQRYRPHFDTLFSAWETFWRGQRKVSLLIYLNEDFQGGETGFPALNVCVRAKTGWGVCWSNRHEPTGQIHPDSLHEGLPVTSGVKYALNVWVREPSWTITTVAEPSPPLHRVITHLQNVWPLLRNLVRDTTPLPYRDDLIREQAEPMVRNGNFESLGANDSWIRSTLHDTGWYIHPLVMHRQLIPGVFDAHVRALLEPVQHHLCAAGFSMLRSHSHTIARHRDSTGPRFGTVAVNVGLIGESNLCFDDRIVRIAPGVIYTFDAHQEHSVEPSSDDKQKNSIDRVIFYASVYT